MFDKNKKVSVFAAYRGSATSKNYVQKGTKNFDKNGAAKNNNRNLASKNGGKLKGPLKRSGSYSDGDNGSSSSSGEDEEDDSTDSRGELYDSSESGEEYTLNNHSSQSSPETPAYTRESLKRRNDEAEGSKPIGAKRTSSTPVGQKDEEDDSTDSNGELYDSSESGEEYTLNSHSSQSSPETPANTRESLNRRNDEAEGSKPIGAKRTSSTPVGQKDEEDDSTDSNGELYDSSESGEEYTLNSHSSQSSPETPANTRESLNRRNDEAEGSKPIGAKRTSSTPVGQKDEEDDSTDSSGELYDSSESGEEYTLNSHSYQSSPETPANTRESLKRRNDEAEGSKPIGAKRTSSTPVGQKDEEDDSTDSSGELYDSSESGEEYTLNSHSSQSSPETPANTRESLKRRNDEAEGSKPIGAKRTSSTPVGQKDEEDDSTDSSGELYDSSESGEEYTLNSHSSQSSPETPANTRESLKRRNYEAEGSKPIGAKRTSSTPVGQSTSAARSIQQPKAPSCPLQRRSCPLPSKKNTVPVKVEVASPNRALLSPQSIKKEPGDSMLCRVKIGLIKSVQPGGDVGAEAGAGQAVNRLEPCHEVHKENSIEVGKRTLAQLIAPMTMATFLRDHWEKSPFRVKTTTSGGFSNLISFKMIDQMLIQNHVEYTTNIDVTSYEDGVRKTLNPDGRALPPSVWAHYQRGCSIRILNPSSYLVQLRQLCVKLQEFFHCLVGANVYLTPPESQGFAPHYDDIEAFVLQVEGKKRWRIYAPTKELPRESSGNLSQTELGDPIMDIVLMPGDLLYFPRGWIHQAITEKDSHSLHITLSAYQQQSYANLMEKLMPLVVKESVEQTLKLRKGLPLDIFQNLGVANAEWNGVHRQKLIQHIQNLAQRLVPTEGQIDRALDQLAIKFQHEALPPTIAPQELKRTVFGAQATADRNGHCSLDYELAEGTAVRLLRANIVRLTVDEGVLRCYYYTDNGLEYCKYEPNFFELEPFHGTVIETLIHAYPDYTKIKDLPPMGNDEDRLEFVEALWERGILMVEKPFKKV
ncbi:bifunctional lysine-specific demethylase and histidyl-hydroxylase NO66 isoform X1 [Drosophila pseudoobscura]|uniref:Bifunctional lysine-specific demethylase and histidyl-hydroxylase NO66 n=1 Tax=Drosophila pseudoobscura pseudoobscura TaxID=46245 RepID=A0A6I8WDM2_DROPS|nr:bifunctional lysine-specific demethylase and histidyl-hydroxylase NO66 isoform X1 [Drosophila pseudoobscura]